MTRLLAAWLLAGPFWESLPVEKWSPQQLEAMFQESPWAQTSEFRGAAPVSAYLATAKPMRMAEAEAHRRRGGGSDPARQEYEDFVAANAGKVIIIAIRNPNLAALSRDEEIERMEEESFLKAGRNKLKLSGYWPPVDADPVLRLVFPRPTQLNKDLIFELYIPGMTAPYRQFVFTLKDLFVGGRPEL